MKPTEAQRRKFMEMSGSRAGLTMQVRFGKHNPRKATAASSNGQATPTFNPDQSPPTPQQMGRVSTLEVADPETLDNVLLAHSGGCTAFLRTGAGEMYIWNQLWTLDDKFDNDQSPIPFGFSSKPVLMREDIVADFVALSAATCAAMAVTSSGSVVGAGNDTWNALGAGIDMGGLSSIPLWTETDHKFTNAIDVKHGKTHSLVLLDNGEVWAAGYNLEGELGQGPEPTAPYSGKFVEPGSGSWLYETHVQVQGLPSNIVQVACAFGISYALTSDGDLYCWGYNGSGDLGLGHFNSYNPAVTGAFKPMPSPVLCPTISDVKMIGCSGDVPIAVKNDNTVWSTGFNHQGQVGNGTFENQSSFVSCSGLSGDVKKIIQTPDSATVMLLMSDGTVYAWGQDFQVISLSEDYEDYRPEPTLLNTDLVSNVVALAGGFGDSFIMVKDDCTLWGWGGSNGIPGPYPPDDGYGESFYVEPNPITESVSWDETPLAGGGEVRAGGNASLAQITSDDVYVWGDGDRWAEYAEAFNPPSVELASGQSLRKNAEGNWEVVVRPTSTPVQAQDVEEPADVTKIEAGYDNLYVLRDDGTIWVAGEYSESDPPGLSVYDSSNNVYWALRKALTQIGEGFIQIVPTRWHLYALDEDGGVWIWGYHDLTEHLGLEFEGGWPDGTFRDYFTKISNLPPVKKLGQGADRICVITEDDELWAWGLNYRYALNSTFSESTTVSYPPQHIHGLTDVKDAWLSYSAHYALKNDGTLWAWGQVFWGLGGAEFGGGVFQSSPAQMANVDNAVSLHGQVSTFGSYYFAIDDTGQLWHWGQGIENAGWPSGNRTPGIVDGADNVLDAACGSYTVSYVTRDGELWWYQDGGFGHTFADDEVGWHKEPTSTDWVQVVQGHGGAGYALKNDCTVWSKGGYSSYVYLADQDPVQVDDEYGGYLEYGYGMYRVLMDQTQNIDEAPPMQEVRAGGNGSLMAASDSEGYGFGEHAGAVTDRTSAVAGVPSGVFEVPSAELREGMVLRLASNGDWHVVAGEAGPQEPPQPASSQTAFTSAVGEDPLSAAGLVEPAPAAVALDVLGDIIDFQLGALHTAVLRNDGSVWSIGDGSLGQFGNGATDNSDVLVESNTTGISKIIASLDYTMGLKSDGTVQAWGGGTDGKDYLGIGFHMDPSPDYTIPNPVVFMPPGGVGFGEDLSPGSFPILEDVENVWGGEKNTWARTSTGLIYMWGTSLVIHEIESTADPGTWEYPHLDEDKYPQALQFSFVPAEYDYPFSASEISDMQFGSGFAIILKTDGTLVSLGVDESGQLGRGPWTGMPEDEENHHLPRPIPSFPGVTQISCGFEHAVALMDDGTVYTWGQAEFSQLGDGATESFQEHPVQVVGEDGIGNLEDIEQIAAGRYHTLALSIDGTVWAWGRGAEGQLGDGQGQESNTPVRVGLLGDLEITEFDACAGGGYEPPTEDLPPFEPEPEFGDPIDTPGGGSNEDEDTLPEIEVELPPDVPLPEPGDPGEISMPDRPGEPPTPGTVTGVEAPSPPQDPCNSNMPSPAGGLCGPGGTGTGPTTPGGNMTDPSRAPAGGDKGPKVKMRPTRPPGKPPGGNPTTPGGNISKFFKAKMCYKNELVLKIIEDLARMLKVDAPEVVESNCDERYTGCFNKGSNIFDALKKMAALCGGVFDPGDPVVVVPPSPTNTHYYFHENTNLFTLTRVYDNSDLVHHVEVYRPPLYGSGAELKPGVSKVSPVVSPFVVDADEVKVIPIYDYNLTDTQIQHIADVEAGKLSGNGAKTQITTLFSSKYKMYDQIHLQRPSIQWFTRWMVRSIEHSFTENGRLTVMQATFLGNDPATNVVPGSGLYPAAGTYPGSDVYPSDPEFFALNSDALVPSESLYPRPDLYPRS